MLLAIVFFNVWGVLQLAALGSVARTVRVRTVLTGVAVGVFFCAPLAAALEYAWAGALAWLAGRPIDDLIAVTGYTVDPPIEEIIRILPLAFMLIVPAIRRQLPVTDCVLIGAAAGAGFGLAEDLYRFGTAPQYATAVPGGWVAPFQSPIVASASGNAFIPSIATAMGGWLPDMGGVRLFGLSAYMGPNVLLIWSSLVGLAVGLWLRLDGPRRWYVSAALLGYASAAHAAHNADVTFGRQLLVTAPFRALSDLEPLMPVAALAIAWWIDRRWHERVLPEHLLAAERGASPRALGTVRAAVARLPESIVWVDRFVRLRRAFNAERHASPHDVEEMRAELAEQGDHLDDLLKHPAAWTPALLAWRDRALAALRERRTLVRLALLSPAILWFVVGGWPETAGVQRALSEGAGRGLTLALAMVAHAWLLWRAAALVRSWPKVARMPTAEPIATMTLRISAVAGVAGFGSYALIRASGLPSATAAFACAHALDALRSLLFPQLVPLVNAGTPLALPAGVPPALPWGAPSPIPAGGAGGMGPTAAPGPLADPLVALGPRAPVFVAGSIAAGAAIIGAAAAVDHAGEVAEQPDRDSPPGGAPALGGESAGDVDAGSAEAPAVPKPPPIPWSDPSVAPGEGWVWKGRGGPGSRQGSWVNEETGDKLHPDLEHPAPIGPHFNWIDGNNDEWRVFPDGRVEPK